MNVRERFEGREVRTVALDPERAPFVQLGFELYDTGRFTLQDLADELYDRGLRSRPGRYPAGAVTDSKLWTMLHDRYYLGIVTHQGVEYPGRHEALISQELFDRVQVRMTARTSEANCGASMTTTSTPSGAGAATSEGSSGV